jgi:putative tryptophan/tyrosine transport system substrate-binding protein
MRRRDFMALLGGAAASPLSAYAQSPTKIWRIGHVDFGDTEGVYARNDFLDKQLERLGYVSGKNIILTEKIVSTRPQEFEAALSSLIPNVDILVVWSTIVAAIARKMTASIPIVFLSVGAPVEVGFVQSLAHPGGNMIGVTFEAASETYAKRLQCS